MKFRGLKSTTALALFGLGAQACDQQEFVETQAGDFRDAPSSSVAISAEGSEVTLEWTPEVHDTLYSVYRSTNPHFAYDGPDSTLVAFHVLGGVFTDDYPLDLDDPLDPGDSHDIGVFYRVVSFTPGLTFIASSPVVGRVSKGYISSLEVNPWVTDRYSKVPLCLDPNPGSATLQQLDQQEFEITEDVLQECLDHGILPEYCDQGLGTVNPVARIHWWDALWSPVHLVQSWVSPPSFYPVLDPNLGEVLVLEGEVINIPPFPENDDGSHGYNHYFQLTGRVPEACEMLAPLHAGNNDLTWPVTAAPTTAAALLAQVDGATAVGYWDQPEQRVRWYPAVPDDDLPTATVPGAMALDFVVEPCSAVYVHIDGGAPDGQPTGASWPPGLECAP